MAYPISPVKPYMSFCSATEPNPLKILLPVLTDVYVLKSTYGSKRVGDSELGVFLQPENGILLRFYFQYLQMCYSSMYLKMYDSKEKGGRFGEGGAGEPNPLKILLPVLTDVLLKMYDSKEKSGRFGDGGGKKERM
ncbi:hypothetical protein CEXT_161581 [Caerostris extrusa]|uniref:Uncharacterized protein n=1 Tax=Caerostris extrusa TaxID=172846 RepID=A0AAV4MP93_CAEEX|nr:hypothetical protein CEXT_161581 [Caerostris extrusa]